MTFARQSYALFSRQTNNLICFTTCFGGEGNGENGINGVDKEDEAGGVNGGKWG